MRGDDDFTSSAHANHWNLPGKRETHISIHILRIKPGKRRKTQYIYNIESAMFRLYGNFYYLIILFFNVKETSRKVRFIILKYLFP